MFYTEAAKLDNKDCNILRQSGASQLMNLWIARAIIEGEARAGVNDSIANEVRLRDGMVVSPQRMPSRVPKGQFLTCISTRIYEAKAIGADGTITDTIITWGGNADNDDPNRDTIVSNDGATGTTR